MGVPNPSRASIAVGLLAVLAASSGLFTLNAQQQRARRSSTPAPHLALIDDYCLSCHDEDHKKGGLALDAIAAHDVARHPDVWEKVVRKLRARQMPPVGQTRPDDATYDAVIASLGDVARPRGRGASESGPHRDVPPAHSHRIPERHPRSAGARRRCRRRCCRPTSPATASTT